MNRAVIEGRLMPAVYLQHLARDHPEPGRLLAGSGLTLEDLRTPSRRITVRQNLHCIKNALAEASDPGWYHEWGVRIAEHFHGPLTLALLSAPSLGRGLEAFLRYFPHRIPWVDVRRRAARDRAALELRLLMDVGPLGPLLVEIPLLILQQYIVTVRNGWMSEAAVELGYDAPANRESYARWFQCRVEFGCARNALIIPGAWLGIPNVGYDEAAWQSALRQCEAADGTAESRDTIGRLRAELYAAFEQSGAELGMPSLGAVAAKLHLSPRTVIRRLRAAGTTFQQELDELRKARARALLNDRTLRIHEVSGLLGFTDPASFAKAFKRWFGVPPRAFRGQLHDQGGSGDPDNPWCEAANRLEVGIEKPVHTEA